MNNLRALPLLSLLFATATASLGCDPVVGARCAPGLDPCGSLCCAEGYYCAEDLTCAPRPSERYDAGLLGPWPHDADAGVDAGRPDAPPRYDAGFPYSDAAVDAGPDAAADAGPDAATDAGPADAEPADAEPSDADPIADAGVKDAEPQPDAATDAGYPDAEVDAGPLDPDAGYPDAGPDAGPLDPDAGPSDAEPSDAADPDATLDAGVLLDATVLDIGPAPDAGPICPLGTQLCDGSCFDTQTSNLHCGACNSPCGPFEACNAGVCAPTCTSPRTQCPNGCVYVQLDPNNCGTCGNVCGSGVCFQGGCVAPAAGHVVVVGHDMRSTHPASLDIAGNSVFLPIPANVSIGTFRAATSMTTQVALDAVITNAASDLGRGFTMQDFVATEVTQRLANVDVFVVFPQEGATDFELLTWGTDWSLALQTFVRRGGTVVLFDAGGANAGTWQLLSAAGLFSATGHSPVAPGEVLDVVAPADAIARGAPLSYPAMANTVTFTSTLTDVVVETRSLPAQPVIFHRVILP